MTAVGLIFTEPLLRIAGAGDDFIVDAVAYFRIILTTNVFNCCAMTMNAAQRGFGNTRVSMVTNVSANLVNVALKLSADKRHMDIPKAGRAWRRGRHGLLVGSYVFHSADIGNKAYLHQALDYNGQELEI